MDTSTTLNQQHAAAAAITPTLGELFGGFFRIGVTGFGGVLPLTHHMLVIDKKWLREEEFAEMLALGQILPGPNVVNLSVAVGRRFHGPRGALAALIGLLLAPFCIAMALMLLYREHQASPTLQGLLSGLAPAATGLLFGMGLRLAAKLERAGWVLFFALLTFVCVGIMRWPLLLSLLGLVPLAVFWAGHLMRKGR